MFYADELTSLFFNCHRLSIYLLSFTISYIFLILLGPHSYKTSEVSQNSIRTQIIQTGQQCAVFSHKYPE